MTHTAFFYASVGSELVTFRIDAERASLDRQSSMTLPNMVQYAWPHPAAPILYVVSSNGGPGVAGDTHNAHALRIDQKTGALASHGPSPALRSRPLHVTVDNTGRYLLVAYNIPSSVSVHRLNGDGTIGEEVPQATGLAVGMFAHQIRVTPSNGAAILVTRGNDAAAGKPEDPGALKVYGFQDGRLSDRASIAPGGGLGFGPRHLDFHPTLPLVYVSLERQNKLHVYRLREDSLDPQPLFVKDSLAEPGKVHEPQHGGTVHVHPNGRFVYMANRSDAMAQFQGTQVDGGGENNIAVFAVDQVTGEPTVIQHASTRGFHPRTFALDPSGRMLVAANLAPRVVRDGERTRVHPATLAAFHVAADGKLEFATAYEVASDGKPQFWSGMVALA